ncbi:MAG: hypothetical protein GXP62_11950, partial [Oligoflexia bacterium]|nr:hypothetical protein [Oligoflexia bacterium]
MLLSPRVRFHSARLLGLLFGLLLGLLCFSAPAAAQTAHLPDAKTLLKTWTSWQPLMRQQARIPVDIDARDLERVARGDIARHRTQLQGIDRVVGLTWSALPRDALWIAIIDDAHDTMVDGLTEIHLTPTRPHQKLLFQHIDLPWPFSDRQWVIDIRNNGKLAASSHDAVWERTWMQSEKQQALAQQISRTDMPADDAIWTP